MKSSVRTYDSRNVYSCSCLRRSCNICLFFFFDYPDVVALSQYFSNEAYMVIPYHTFLLLPDSYLHTPEESKRTKSINRIYVNVLCTVVGWWKQSITYYRWFISIRNATFEDLTVWMFKRDIEHVYDRQQVFFCSWTFTSSCFVLPSIASCHAFGAGITTLAITCSLCCWWSLSRLVWAAGVKLWGVVSMLSLTTHPDMYIDCIYVLFVGSPTSCLVAQSHSCCSLCSNLSLASAQSGVELVHFTILFIFCMICLLWYTQPMLHSYLLFVSFGLSFSLVSPSRFVVT